MSKHIELAKKLKKLAEQGIGGEKTNASTILEAYMLKYNISLSDIQDMKNNEYFMNVPDVLRKLFHQIVNKVYNKIRTYYFPPEAIKEHNLQGNTLIICTVSDWIEIDMMYNVYSKLYLEELKVFNRAFYFANDLLIDSKSSIGKPSENDLQEEIRAYNLSKQIKSNTNRLRKQISKQC
jgi:hypothetical protein